MIRRSVITALSVVVAISAQTMRATAQAEAPHADSGNAGIAAAIDGIVARANADGLPGDAVRAKALEGMSRGIAGDRVVRVVAAYADSLRAARDLLVASGDRSPAAPELVAAAGALTAGVSRPAATRLAAAARARPVIQTLVVPFVVTGDLVARGVPADSAAAAVGVALHRGASDAELWRLREAIAHDIASGAPPLYAAMLRSGAATGKAPSPPASRPPASTPPGPP
jgi:hypothetical protein